MPGFLNVRRLKGGVPHIVLSSLCGSLLVSGVLLNQPTKQDPQSQQLEKELTTKVQPLLEKYCLDCHSEPEPSASLDLEKLTLEHISENPDIYEKVIQFVRSEVMPPPAMGQPSKKEREEIVSWIQRAVSSQCDLNEPGKVTIRRLNRFEYNNTVRDLFGIQFKPADDFPSDNVGHGFDNIGDVLSLSPIHLEKYLDAAKEVSEKAIYVNDPKVYVNGWENIVLSGNTRRGTENEIVFFANHILQMIFDVGVPGEYMVKVTVAGTRAGVDLPKLAVLNGSKMIHDIPIDALANKPKEIKFPIEIKDRALRLGIGFMNDFYDPDNPNPARRDRNLMVYDVEVSGPFATVEELPDSHTEILFKYPVHDKDYDAPKEVLSQLMTKVYRRPATDIEIERILEIYKLVRGKGDSYEKAIQVCLQAMLVNPNFLFRVELDNSTGEGNAQHLSSYELASRLSYFIYGSTPDAQLLEAAAKGDLQDDSVLEEQVQRMLASPKAQALASGFATQWLQIQRISEVSPDPEQFKVDDELLTDMEIELETFFNHLVRENRPIKEIINADYTFLNNRLAAFYGIPGVLTRNFEMVKVPRDSHRGGVLGMASILTVTSNPNRTSPVKRGKWVMEALLGTPPPPPPPDVGVLADDKEAITTKNIRERMELHRTNPECAACHKPLDALGFSLENYDAVGKWRTKDGPFDVDPTGEMPDGTKLNGVDSLKSLLVKRENDFVRNLAERMLTYATGRGMNAADRCAIDDLTERIKKRGGKMQDLIVEVVKSNTFRMKGTEKR